MTGADRHNEPQTYDCVTGDCGCVPEAMRSCPGRLDFGEVTVDDH